jgi:hypothetical protein
MKTYQQILNESIKVIDIEDKYLKYQDNSVKYPDLSKVNITPNINGNMFNDAIRGDYPFAELNAIQQYTGASMRFQNEDLFGIGYIEMQHMKALMTIAAKMQAD